MKRTILSAIVAMVILISAVACTYSSDRKSIENHPNISAEELIRFAEESSGF